MNSKLIFALLETDEAVAETIDKMARQTPADVRWDLLRFDRDAAALRPAIGTGHHQTTAGLASGTDQTNAAGNHLAEEIIRRFGLIPSTARTLADGLRNGALLMVLNGGRHPSGRLHRLLQATGGRIVATVDSVHNRS